ncbi:MAG: flagellar basal body rod protein FlgC [Bdellovibrionales bacterium]
MTSGAIFDAMFISSSGMRTQGTRLRVISENIANAGTTGNAPGADPYTRQTITFKNEMDREMGIRRVQVDEIGEDTKSDFVLKFEPDHPAADEGGYVKYPNVSTLIEVMDSREAQRSYEANLGMIEQARTMALRTIDMLRG